MAFGRIKIDALRSIVLSVVGINDNILFYKSWCIFFMFRCMCFIKIFQFLKILAGSCFFFLTQNPGCGSGMWKSFWFFFRHINKSHNKSKTFIFTQYCICECFLPYMSIFVEILVLFRIMSTTVATVLLFSGNIYSRLLVFQRKTKK